MASPEGEKDCDSVEEFQDIEKVIEIIVTVMKWRSRCCYLTEKQFMKYKSSKGILTTPLSLART